MKLDETEEEDDSKMLDASSYENYLDVYCKKLQAQSPPKPVCEQQQYVYHNQPSYFNIGAHQE
jgi:hypothetical protein